VAGDGSASNIIEQLSLIDAVKKVFQHGSLPSPHYLFGPEEGFAKRP
jgi:hypothetical protein